jgi:hypothetical protein
LLKAHAGCSFQKNFCSYCKYDAAEQKKAYKAEQARDGRAHSLTLHPELKSGITACDSNLHVTAAAASFFESDLPDKAVPGGANVTTSSVAVHYSEKNFTQTAKCFQLFQRTCDPITAPNAMRCLKCTNKVEKDDPNLVGALCSVDQQRFCMFNHPDAHSGSTPTIELDHHLLQDSDVDENGNEEVHTFQQPERSMAKYKDPGATCSTGGGDVDLFISSNTVDLHNPGTYAVNYKCVSGTLLSATKIRTVVVMPYNCKCKTRLAPCV